MRIESKDTLRKAEGKDVSEVLGGGTLSLVAQILRALGVETGVSVITQSARAGGLGPGRVLGPGGGGGGARSARAVGRELDRGRPLADRRATRRRAHRGAHRRAGLPRGPPRRGARARTSRRGPCAWSACAADPARVEESLLLVDAGVTRFSGINNWDVFKGQIDGDPTVREALAAIGAVAVQVREALLADHFEDGVRADRRGVGGPEAARARRDHARDRSHRRGGAGGRRRGQGLRSRWRRDGGRLGPAWSPRTRAPRGGRAGLEAAGFRVFPARVDLRGLEVEGA